MDKDSIIAMLLDVVRRAHAAMDNTEDDGEGLHWNRDDFDALSAAMDKLDDLPDDRPGYVMGPAAKADWALQQLATPAPTAPTKCKPVAWMAEDGRVVSAFTKEVAMHAKTAESFSIPLYRHPAPAPTAPNWIDKVIQQVAELPDRDSPADQPEMMLVSADELRGILEDAAAPASREQEEIRLAAISTACLGYWKEGDTISPQYDHPALRDAAQLYAKYEGMRQDALRWRAFIGSARLRMFGSAGLVEPQPEYYAHMGMEIWTKYGRPGEYDFTEENKVGIEWITKYADIAIEAQKTRP